MKRSVFVLWGALLAVLAFSPAWAAETEYTLGEIVVSGEAMAESDKVSSLAEVTAEEIHSAGVRNLNEAIALLPGVYVRTGGDGTPRIDIRGMRTRNVVILLDGVPLNSTYDYQFDPTLIPMENVARIKVVRGATSVLYGPNGNAGAINIITKKGEGKLGGFAGLEYAEEGAMRARGGLSGSTDTVSMFVSGDYYDTAGFRLAESYAEQDGEDGGLRENSARDSLNLYANALYTPTDDTQVGLSLRSFQGSHETPALIYDDDVYGKQRYEAGSVNDGLSLQLSGQHDFSDLLSLRGWVYRNAMNEQGDRYDDETLSSQDKKGAQHQDYDTEIMGATLMPSLDFGKYGILTSSLSYSNQNWDGTQVKVKTNNEGFKSDIDENRTIEISSAAVEYEVRPVKELGFVAGVGGHYMSKDSSGSESEASYFVGMDVAPWENTLFHVNHARKVRFPSLKELYDGDSANPDLSAEITYHYEVGVEQTFPSARTTVGVTGFIVEAEDFIEKDAITELRDNFEKYEMTGVEAFVDTDVTTDWNLKASYTYTEATNEGDDATYARLQNRPRHMAAIESRYTCPLGTRFYLSYSFVGDQVDHSADEDNPGLLAVSDAHLVNARIAHSFNIKDQQELELYVGVNNAFDHDYEQSVGLPGAGRTFFTGVEYRF